MAFPRRRFIISIAQLSKADLKVRLYDDKNRGPSTPTLVEAQSTVVDAGLQARLPL